MDGEEEKKNVLSYARPEPVSPIERPYPVFALVCAAGSSLTQMTAGLFGLLGGDLASNAHDFWYLSAILGLFGLPAVLIAWSRRPWGMWERIAAGLEIMAGVVWIVHEVRRW